jgi:hypothetical protein
VKRSLILFFLCLGTLAFVGGYHAVAKLYAPLRDGFHARPGDAGEAFDVQIAQKICGNAIDYKFMDFQYPYNHPQNEAFYFDFVTERYGYRTNCLMNDAMNTAVKEVNDIAKEQLGGEDVDALTGNEDQIEVCEDIRLHTIQSTQQLKTELLDDGKSQFDAGADANTARYELEDVSRTMIREACGYTLYLETLRDDTEGFAYEFEYKNGETDGLKFEDFDAAWSLRRGMIDQEIKQSNDALYSVLDFYSNFLTSYKLNAGIEATIVRMEAVNDDFGTMAKKVEILSGQFPNSTSNTCPQ